MARLDVRAHPDTLSRRQVVDLTSGAEIPDIAYADDEIGVYAVWKRKNDYSRDIETDANGNPLVVEHSPGRGAIRIVRR